MVRNSAFGLLASWLFLVLAGSAQAARPCDTLLPDSTKAFVSVPNVDKLLANWNKSPLGRLLDDPAMEAFRKDLDKQLQAKGLEVRDKIGITVQDLDGLASGELSMASIRNNDGKASLALVVDVAKNVPATEKVLAKVAAFFAQNGGVAGQQKVGAVAMTTYKMPAKAKQPATEAAYFLHEGFLVMSDNIAVATDIAGRIVAPAKNALDSLAAYQMVMKRTREGTTFDADLSWFVDPIGLGEAIQNGMKKPPHGAQDPLKLVRKEGFDAVKSVGGLVAFSDKNFGSIHRTSVYAPPPFQRSMQMLKFPNGGNFTPEAWVPADIDSYVTFQWDMLNAFDNFGTLFDELFGEGEEGVWKDVLDSIETDPNGPQLNLRKDLIAHLGTRATMLTDTAVPITPSSQIRVFAAETTNPKALAASIDKAMQNDKQIKIREFQGHKIYEIIPEEEGLPELNIEPGGSDKPAAKPADAEGAEAAKPRQHHVVLPGEGEKQARILPNSAVVVAHGYLFISTSVDYLEKIVANPKAEKPLANDGEFVVIEGEIKKLATGPGMMQNFTRNADKWFQTYELFRLGQLPQADTPLAQALNAAFNDTPEGELPKARLDGTKLPGFEIVRKYLTLGGAFAMTEADGWFIEGFTTANAAAPQAEARLPAEKK